MASWQLLSNIYSNVRFRSSKDSTTLTDASLLILANKYFYQIVRQLIDLNEDVYAEISSTALVAAQKEYSLPSDSASTPFGSGSIDVQRVEVTYDGTNWYVADEIDLTNMKTPILGDTDANINANFSKSAPKYAYADRSIWLFPVPVSTDSVAGGNTNLRIYWIKRPGELTADTNTPELPKDFLNILEEGMLIDVFQKFGRAGESTQSYQKFNQMIETMRTLEARDYRRLTLSPADLLEDYE